MIGVLISMKKSATAIRKAYKFITKTGNMAANKLKIAPVAAITFVAIDSRDSNVLAFIEIVVVDILF